jgi:hypothetical protein
MSCPVCLRPLAEHSKHDRYNHSEKGHARWLAYYDRRMDDPDPVRRMTFRAKEAMRKHQLHMRKAREHRHAQLDVERAEDVA